MNFLTFRTPYIRSFVVTDYRRSSLSQRNFLFLKRAIHAISKFMAPLPRRILFGSPFFLYLSRKVIFGFQRCQLISPSGMQLARSDTNKSRSIGARRFKTKVIFDPPVCFRFNLIRSLAKFGDEIEGTMLTRARYY